MTATSFADWLQIDPNSKALWHFALFAFALVVLYRMITNGDFAAKVLGVCVILFGLWFLAGCSNGPTDPLGMTSRTQLRTDASVTIARSQADAEIAKAQADEAARIAEAQSRASSAIAAEQARIVTEQTRQNGMTARVMAWAGMIPLALLILAVAVVVGLVVNWQGHIWYARTVQAGSALMVQQASMLDAEKLRMLESYAEQQNMQLIERDGEYLLTDGQRTVRALLKG